MCTLLILHITAYASPDFRRSLAIQSGRCYAP